MPNRRETDKQSRAHLRSLMESGDDASLRRAAAELHPADIAEILDSLETVDDKLRLYRLLPADTASDTLRNAQEHTRQELLEHIPDVDVAEVIERLDTDDAADILADLPEQRQRLLLDRSSPETRREVGDLLSYREDSAGGIMKTEVASARATATVGEATEYIRSRSEDFHDVHNIFVTDDKQRLLGLVPLRRLLLDDDSIPLRAIMETDLISVDAEVDQEEVAHIFERYDLLSLPVVDALNRLVGRITVDDIVDVIEEEATEDMLKLAGIGDEPLAPTSPLQQIRSRFPWLGLNLLTATVSAATVALFEETIAKIAVAAGLMTIVASQGGNAGVQTMTLVVRGLALGEVHPSQLWRLLGRELLTALGNGLLLGCGAGIIVYVWRHDWVLSAVIAVAMVINLLIAALVGSLAPLGLKMLKVDPAVSSAVLVTTATDMLGFFVFLSLLSLATR